MFTHTNFKQMFLGVLITSASMFFSSYAGAFERQYYRMTDYGVVMRGGLATADFTGDGIDELFVASNNPLPLLIAFKQDVSALKVTSISPLALSSGGATQLHIWQGANGPQLISVSGNGWQGQGSTVRIFAGWPLSMVTTYDIPAGLAGSAVGDLNGDGQAEMVALVGQQTQAFRLSDGVLLWTLPNSATNIVLANLDADPALEIVLAGTIGLVFDGVTRTQEWSYPDGFGSYLAAGNVNSGTPGFVGANDWGYFTIFRGAPWSPVWDFNVFDIDAVAVANLDGVGADEIIEGDGQWGSVKIIDSQTRTLRNSIPNGGYGIAAVGSIRTAASQGRDVVFAPSGTSGTDARLSLRVAQPANGQTLFELNSEPGGIGATSIGDIDADGQVELIVANGSSQPGRIRIVDRDSGVEEWVSPQNAGNANSPFYIAPKFLFQTQLDADPAQELVVVGTSTYDGRIVVLDGQSREVQLQIGDYSTSHPLGSREIVGAALLDYNSDGFKDIALITQPTSTGENGIRVHVFSLRTGLPLWESIRMGQGFATARGIFVQPSDGQDLLVAALPDGLRAFGAQSQLLEWTYTEQIQKALYQPNAPGGAEIVLERADGTMIHLDAATRGVHRSYQLGELSRAIVALPGAPYLLVATANALTLRTLQGQAISSTNDTLTSQSLSPIAIAPAGRLFDVLTGTGFGYAFHKLSSDDIFADSFE